MGKSNGAAVAVAAAAKGRRGSDRRAEREYFISIVGQLIKLLGFV